MKVKIPSYCLENFVLIKKVFMALLLGFLTQKAGTLLFKTVSIDASVYIQNFTGQFLKL